MGIAAGLAWIIIGVLYMVYKYQTEDGGKTPGAAIGKIIMWAVIIIGGGTLLMKISESLSDDASFFLTVLLGIPAGAASLGVLVWLIAGDIHEATKDEPLKYEVGRHLYWNLSQSESTFRYKWYMDNNELLTNDQVKFLYKMRHGVVDIHFSHDSPIIPNSWKQSKEYHRYLQSFLPDGLLGKLTDDERSFFFSQLQTKLDQGGINAARDYVIWQFDSCPISPFTPQPDIMKNPTLGLNACQLASSENLSEQDDGTISQPPDPDDVFARESYQRFMSFYQHPDIQELIQKFQDSGDWPTGQYDFNYVVYKSFVCWAGQDLVKILLNTYQDEGGIEKEEG